jgi:hypothetical protein
MPNTSRFCLILAGLLCSSSFLYPATPQGGSTGIVIVDDSGHSLPSLFSGILPKLRSKQPLLTQKPPQSARCGVRTGVLIDKLEGNPGKANAPCPEPTKVLGILHL